MVEHKMFISFLQGIALFLTTTCKAQITLDKIDSNGLNLNVNAPFLRKTILQNLEWMKVDDNLKRGASYIQKEIIKNFGQINDTDLKVHMNFDEPFRHTKQFFKRHRSQPSASDTKTASLTEAISEIDEKLKKYRKTLCDFNPPKPDFESKGHRTSQARCLDYIWDIKLEEERSNELCSGQDDSVMPRIASGKNVKHAGEYPHMGAIGWPAKEVRWIFLCGSSLISNKFVLTVAHCHSLSRHDMSRVTYHRPKIVRFGVVNIKTDGHPVDIKIRRFISYEKYDYTVKYNDIALIELEDVVRFTKNIRPACLWHEFSLQNMKTAAVTGWGVSDLSTNSKTTSPKLQVARLDIIDYRQCRDKLKMKETSDWSGLAHNQICAGKLNGTASACEGDSGGPLQIQLVTNTSKPVHSIIGVTSVGFGCGMTKFPSIYTRVSSFIKWIEKEVWEFQESVGEALTTYRRSHPKHTYRPQTDDQPYQKNNYRNWPSKHWYHHSQGHQS